jgi:ribosomal protein S18 acetylase RimI-like enzyme
MAHMGKEINDRFQVRQTLRKDYGRVKEILDDSGLLRSELTERKFRDILVKGKGFCLVAVQDGKLCGTVFGFDEVFTAHMSKLAVDRFYRQWGIGTALVRELMARFEAHKDLEIVFAHVEKGNETSIRVLQSIGFGFRDETHHFMDVQLRGKPVQ